MTKELLLKLGLSDEQAESVNQELTKELSQKDTQIKNLEDTAKELTTKNQELTASVEGEKARAETFEKLYKDAFAKPQDPQPQPAKTDDVFEAIMNA